MSDGNEWDKLQAENEERWLTEQQARAVSAFNTDMDEERKLRRVEAAEAEVRIMHEIKGLLIGLAIIALLVLVAGVAWTLTHR